jgi:hypothetical protein
MENQELENVQDTATSTEEQAPQLTIADLQNIRNLIDVAVRRGAFGAQETTAVGSVFDRLNVFLNAVAPAVEQAPADDQAPATTEETAA